MGKNSLVENPKLHVDRCGLTQLNGAQCQKTKTNSSRTDKCVSIIPRRSRFCVYRQLRNVWLWLWSVRVARRH